MRKTLLYLSVLAMAIAAGGCAITDYSGIPGHHTQSEAKLWGQEISFIVGIPDLDGTYSYTVKYDNTHPGPITIASYRNPVPNSFSRDGEVDRDGDNVQGNSGLLGGKFLTEWIAVDTDTASGNCGFFANITQDKSHGAGPLTALCATVNEEIDSDLELQSSFASFGDLLANIWSGALSGKFTAELNGITLNGVSVPLAQPLAIGAVATSLRPGRLSVDLTQPAGKALIRSILDHTSNGVPVSVGLSFNGGMAINLPSQFKVAFNHDALWHLL